MINFSNTDYKVSSSGNVLEIPVVYPRLAGKYRCDVKNSEGERLSESELVVQGKIISWLVIVIAVNSWVLVQLRQNFTKRL